jgi:amino acid transporter
MLSPSFMLARMPEITPEAPAPHLERGLGLWTATSANMLTMVGAGPFITIPLILGTMQGPQAMLGWLAGAAIAICDGLAWAELGSAIPQSGGGYRYVLQSYGANGPGRLMSFLFLWQIVAITPLIFASGAVGFSGYAMYLFPSMTPREATLLAVGVCVFSTALIYRRIDDVGRVCAVVGVVVLAAAIWMVGDGVLHGHLAGLAPPAGAFRLSRGFWVGLGGATLYAMFDYGGYQTVCFLGGEIVRPEATIPRSIIIAILGVGALYVAMNVSILSVIPWQDAMRSRYVASDFIARLHGSGAASVMTVLILVIILGGVFAGMLGSSRIPHAAAEEGRFFRAFARLHPTGHFPSFSVLFIGVVTALCCLLDLDALIRASTVIIVLTQSIPVLGAVVMLRKRRPDLSRPFKMVLYPLPLLAALGGWIYIVCTSGAVYVAVGFGVLLAGIGAYLWRAKGASEWPWPTRT